MLAVTDHYVVLFFPQDCGKPLSIEADERGCFPLDGHVLCMKCHTTRAKAVH